jgi:hypothetical protein
MVIGQGQKHIVYGLMAIGPAGRMVFTGEEDIGDNNKGCKKQPLLFSI